MTDAASGSQNIRAMLREELIESECRMENLIAGALREFSMKVGRLLHEAFSLNMAKEGHKERSLLLVSLLRNNFGQAIGDDLLNEWLPVDSSGKENTLLPQDLSQTAQSPIIQTTTLKNQTVNCSPKSKRQSALQQRKSHQGASSSSKKVQTRQGNKNSAK